MNKGLNILNNGVTMTSIEVVDLINNFRKEEGNRKELKHKNFMASIRTELNVLETLGVNNELNIQPVKYLDNKGEERPCFKLNKKGIMQMLNKESILVRYKTQEYVEVLEEKIKNNIPKLNKRDETALKILRGEVDVFVLKEYTDEVEKDISIKLKDGTDKILTLTGAVKEINNHLDTPILTTTLLNRFLSEILHLGKYRRVGKDKKRSFVPNKEFMDLFTKSGACLTGSTVKGDKVKMQYSVDLIEHILKYKSQLEQFLNAN